MKRWKPRRRSTCSPHYRRAPKPANEEADSAHACTPAPKLLRTFRPMTMVAPATGNQKRISGRKPVPGSRVSGVSC